MPFAATWMDLEIMILSELSQTEKDKYHIIWHKWTYLRNRNRLTDIENRLVVANGGRGMDWEFGIGRCKLLYIGWINNKILLYSTGNYIQYPGINHNGKECIYMYNWITLLYSRNLHNIVNQLYFNKINFLKKGDIRGKWGFASE